MTTIEATINVTDTVVFNATGVVSLDVAAAMIGCSTRTAFSIVLVNTTVEVSRPFRWVRVGPATGVLLNVLFVSLVSMHTPISLLLPVVDQWGASLLFFFRILIAIALAPFKAVLPTVGVFNMGSVTIASSAIAFLCENVMDSTADCIDNINVSTVFLGSNLRNAQLLVTNITTTIRLNAAHKTSSMSGRFSGFACVVHNTTIIENSTVGILGVGTRGGNGVVSLIPVRVSGIANGVVIPSLMLHHCKIVVSLFSNNAVGREVGLEHLLPISLGGGAPAVIMRAWPNNKTILLSGTTVVITQSNFTGYDRLFGSDALRTSDMRGVAAATEWTDGSELLLGCNSWNGKLFPTSSSSWLILDDVPFWARRFSPRDTSSFVAALVDGSISDDAAECAQSPAYLYSESVSVTSSTSNTVVAPPPPLVLPTISPNTAVLALAAMDGVFIIALGQSSCGSAELKKATSDTRFLLSPFFDAGHDAAALGNLALLILCIVAHAFVAFAIGHHVNASTKVLPSQLPLSQRFVSLSTHRSSWPPLVFLRNAGGMVTSLRPSAGAVAAQFPNLSIVVGTYALTGASFAATNALSSGSMGSIFPSGSSDYFFVSLICGAMSLIIIIGVVVAYCYVAFAHPQQLLKGFRFEGYPFFLRHSATSALPAFAVPLGRWGPLSWRSSLGKLRSIVRPGKYPERCALLPFFVALFTNSMLGIEGPSSSWCPAQWTILILATGAAGALVVMIRPARIPLVNIFLAVQYILQTILYILSALLQSNVFHQKDDAGSRRSKEGIVTGLMALSTLYTVVSIIKMVHLFAVIVWERNQNAAMMKLEEAAATLEATMWNDSFASPVSVASRGSGGGVVRRATRSGSNSTRHHTNSPLPAGGGGIESVFLVQAIPGAGRNIVRSSGHRNGIDEDDLCSSTLPSGGDAHSVQQAKFVMLEKVLQMICAKTRGAGSRP